ncbi:hypothetical protein PVK06_002888 [Gossypium arboreum]|uniref:Reverse transcriptase n=1 Tax=Gossypium arboreum TaxID=29729 RepID=A0ABR0R4U5_GOSAR|nr:hypothetical protein PVK06_002888 [Gossypium arboreum]
MLKEWSRKNVRNGQCQSQELKPKIGDIMEKNEGSDMMHSLGELKEELKMVWEQEELFWFQRARNDWLMFGDKNTRFSHKVVVQLRQLNKILKIKNRDCWFNDEEQIMNYFTSFYKDLFKSERVMWNDELLGVIPSGVTYFEGKMRSKALEYVKDKVVLRLKVYLEINAAMANFWWGQKANERRIHWKSWELLTLDLERQIGVEHSRWQTKALWSFGCVFRYTCGGDYV